VFDFVVDALTEKLVARLPRTAGAGEVFAGTDELGASRQIEGDRTAAGLRLVDATLGIETYDFGFKDPEVRAGLLPGNLIINPPPLSPAAISAHANATAVSRFLRQTLMRNNIDNLGGRMVSSVNCLLKGRNAHPAAEVGSMHSGARASASRWSTGRYRSVGTFGPLQRASMSSPTR
jgi:Zn-dependent metalloprotease